MSISNTSMPAPVGAMPDAIRLSAATKATIQTINALASNYQADKYLEIGVQKGATFFYVDMPHKIGVDPALLFEESMFSDEGRLFFREPSDNFFARLKKSTVTLPTAFNDAAGKPTFDIIFIDGLHTFEQSFRDFKNSHAFAHENTIWLLGNTVPSDPYSALPDQAMSLAYRKAANLRGNPWHGDVFKTVFAIHDLFSEFSYCTLMRANPQTVVWRAAPSERKSVFASSDAIAQLDFFAMLRHAALLMPVKETMLFHLLGMTLDPASYGDANTWKKLCFAQLRNVDDVNELKTLKEQLHIQQQKA